MTNKSPPVRCVHHTGCTRSSHPRGCGPLLSNRAAKPVAEPNDGRGLPAVRTRSEHVGAEKYGPLLVSLRSQRDEASLSQVIAQQERVRECDTLTATRRIPMSDVPATSAGRAKSTN